MKKRCFFLIIFLTIFLATAVSALEITLTSPADNYQSSSSTVSFECSATANESRLISSISLFSDFSGAWQEKIVSNFNENPATTIFTLTNLPNGTFTWTCKATDNSSNTIFGANRTFIINTTVASVSFSGTIPNQTWAEDNSISNVFDLDDYFSSGPYSVSGNSSTIITIDANNQVSFSSAANWSGIENIKFTSNGVDSNIVTLTVNGVNDAPLYSTISNITLDKNENITINVSSYFFDIENDVLIFSATHSNNLTVIFNSSMATIVPDENWGGLASLIFKAQDGNATTSANNISVIVGEGLNHAPLINSYSPSSSSITISSEETQSFSVNASDSDNDTLFYSWFIDDSKQSTATGSSFTYSDNEVGSHTIKVVVSDGSVTINNSWTLVVNEDSSASDIFDVEEQDLESIIDTTEFDGYCGDGVVGTDENCGNCPNDVKCAQGFVCSNNDCVEKTSLSTGLIVFFVILLVLAGIGAGIYFLSMRKTISENRNRDKILQQEEMRSLSELGERPPSDINDFYKSQESQLTPIQRYIKDQKTHKVTNAQIKKKLKSKGWSDKQIKEAFESLK